MKKVFAFILVLCMVLSCVPTFAETCTCAVADAVSYLDNENGTHTVYCAHGKVVDDDATCAYEYVDGVQKCTKCGGTGTTCNHLDDISSAVNVQLWKSENGQCWKYCKKCGKILTEKKAHEAADDATWSSIGTKTCKNCSQSIKCAHNGGFDVQKNNTGAIDHTLVCKICGATSDTTNGEIPWGQCLDKDGNAIVGRDTTGVTGTCESKTCVICGNTFKGADAHVAESGTGVDAGDGTHYAKCSKCGQAIIKENEVDSWSHDKMVSVVVDGERVHKCGSCGAVIKVCDATYVKLSGGMCVLDCAICNPNKTATAHEWSKTAVNGKYTCQNCGLECKHANTTPVFGYEPTCCKNMDTGACGHNHDGLTDGTKCEDCGSMIVPQEVIEAKGHVNAVETIKQAATCKVPGLKHVKCSCGFEADVEIPTTEAHTYVNMGVVKTCKESTKCKAATCNATGLDHYVCSNCGAVKHVETEKVDHKLKTVYVNYEENDGKIVVKNQKVTCTEPVASYQKCTVCGKKIGEYKIERSTGDTHEYTNTKYITPTCEIEGGTWKSCKNVGCEYGEWVGEHGYMGHNKELQEANSAHAKGTKVTVTAKTCTTDGEYYYECKYCSARLDESAKELAAGKYVPDKAAGHINDGDLEACFTDHKDATGVWTYVAPTCKTNGYWESTCTICKGNYRTVSFDDCNQCAADVERHKWVMGSVITKAICGEKDGTAQTVCSVCGTIAKHDGTTDCICTELSDKVHTCADMLELDPKVEPAGKDILWKIDATTAGKEHDYQVTNDTYKKPTCQETGYGYVTCSRCNKTEWSDSIAKLNHKDAEKWIEVYVAATCTAPAHYEYQCSICGATQLNSDNTVKTEVIKDADDKEVAPELGHNFKFAAKVTLCSKGNVLKYQCTRCGATEYRELNGTTKIEGAHAGLLTFILTGNNNNYNEADLKKFVWETKLTCTTDGYYVKGACPNCDYVADDARLVMVPAKHMGTVSEKVVDANCTDPQTTTHTCSLCKETWTTTAGTKLELTDATMKVPANHKSWGVVKYIINETCTEDGFGYYGCSACNYIEDTAKTVPAAHTWSKELIVVTEPTCGDDGVGHKVCAICGYEDDENITIKATGKCVFGEIKHESGNCADNGYITYECLICGKGKEGYNYLKSGTYTVGNASYTIADGKMTISVPKYVVKADGTIEENGTASVAIVNIIAVLPKGDHEWGASELREPTCTLPGGMRKTCKVCGVEKFVGNTGTAALGHDVVCIETPENCYMAGKKVFSCLRCNETLYTETIPSCGHEMEEVEADSVASTCSTKGYKMMVCKHEGCGYSYKEVQPYNTNNHEYVIDLVIREATCTRAGAAMAHCAYCDFADAVIALNGGHKWEVTGVKTAATCTSTGIDNVKCSVCGKTGTQVSKALGHTMVTEEIAVDCENAAGTLTYCSVCSYKTKFVKTGSSALGHKWGEKVYVEATCEADAHYESTCERCGEVAVTKIATNEPKYQAKLNHKGSKLVETVAATCTERGYDVRYCSLCGKEYKTNYTYSVDYVNGHDWEITFTIGNTEITCGNPGYAKVKCNICGMEKQDNVTPKHTWSDNIITDNIVYKVCTVCGKMDVIWADSSFTGYNGCTTITINNKGEKVVTGTHKGLVVKASKDATCTEAGELGHIECTVCGTVVREGGVIPAHTTKEVAAVEATCTTEGSTAGTFCLVCNKYVVAPQKIAAKGHKWVDVPAQDATATKPGYTAGIQCENCKEWKEGHEEIPVKAASLKRTAVLRKTAELLGERVALLSTDDAISITGELVNGFYPVSTADGDGYIHNSYIAVA